jgi:hypothetical protein
MEIFLVDAFTDKRFEGNRAGVVLSAASLSREEKTADSFRNKCVRNSVLNPTASGH